MAIVWASLAITLWGSLAVLTSQLGQVPRFFLVGIALVIGSFWSLRELPRLWRRPRAVGFAIFGIFGYHALLFFSFALAPVVEANLINYLWPIFIVLFSGLFLPGYGLSARHWIGAALGFGGICVLLAPQLTDFAWENFLGYVLAFAAAITWGIFSVFTKKMRDFTAADLALGSLISGILALILHAFIEPAPQLDAGKWGLLFILGIGPMGIAFFAWDRALKTGDPRVIGTLSFFTPLISTLGLAWIDAGTQLGRRTAVTLTMILTGAFFARPRTSA